MLAMFLVGRVSQWACQILVIGATGSWGERLSIILTMGIAVRALSRESDRARGLARKGAEVVTGDLVDPCLRMGVRN